MALDILRYLGRGDVTLKPAYELPADPSAPVDFRKAIQIKQTGNFWADLDAQVESYRRLLAAGRHTIVGEVSDLKRDSIPVSGLGGMANFSYEVLLVRTNEKVVRMLAAQPTEYKVGDQIDVATLPITGYIRFFDIVRFGGSTNSPGNEGFLSGIDAILKR